jgi:ABC-type nitrate/sulfonate/bicarbonate transport system substrate-binding protein
VITKRLRRVPVLAVAGLALLTAGLVGCGSSDSGSSSSTASSSSTSSSSSKPTDVLFYSGVKNADEVIPQLAVDQKLFPPSVDVDLKYGTQAVALPLLATGKAQFLLNPSPSVEVAPEGQPIKWAANYENIANAVFISQPDIKTCEQMRGKRLGIIIPGSTLALLAQQALKTCGLTPSDYKTVPLGDFGAVLAAFQAGTVDGIVTDPGAANAARANVPELNVLYDFYAQKFPWNYMGIATNSDWARDNPEALKAVLQGLNAALKMLHEEPEKAKASLATVTGLQGPALDGAYKLLDERLQQQLTPVSDDAEQRVLEVMKESGAKVADDPASYFLDPTYLQQALGK